MIDLAALRHDPDRFRRAWSARGAGVDVDALLAEDAKVRELKHRAETLQAEANAAAKAIGEAKRKGVGAEAALARAAELRDQVNDVDASRAGAERAFDERLLTLPNPTLDEVPVGADAASNRVVASWGEQPSFAFAPKPHWELGEALGVLDLARGARLAASGFVVLSGTLARLSRALISWFLDVHTREHGYVELAVPYLVQSRMMQGTGQLPKFADQSYRLRDADLWLIPTAEVPVTNLHGDEILEIERLPLKYTAHTPCFRSEAGAAGVGTRGLTRVHQFDKVELVWLTAPERSRQDLLTLRGHAERLLRDLGLHHRVLELCAGDTGFSAAHTYDLEVWSPGTQGWLEVSSCSTFTDFQARRASLRFREKGGKPRFLHTLNGSALALPRCMIALLESGQQGDGSIELPKVLHPYLGGETRIARPSRQAAG